MEKVKGHYRAGKWIGPYMRADRDRKLTLGTAVREDAVVYHTCCETLTCCVCDQRLKSGETEPVGLGLREKHRLCGGCLWEMSGVQASLAAKRVGSGKLTEQLSSTTVEKYSALLDTPEKPPKDGS